MELANGHNHGERKQCSEGMWNYNTGMSKKKGEDHVTLLLVLIGLVGVGLVSYPSIANWWNSFHQSRAVSEYTQTVANMNSGEYTEILDAADAYNQRLAETGILWNMSDEQKADYESQLDVSGTGVMGYINIPKIEVTLPIYHGTSEEVLQIAVGHIEQTSLPVGGESTHAVISSHRGLPSAKLFTDLDEMAAGDTFTITVLDRTVTYEVDQIRVVLPDDLSALAIEYGKDYCTLVTCTPYGVNTHRLLVRGHRVANAQGEARVVADAVQINPARVAPFIAIPILIIAIISVFIRTSGKKKE